MPVNLSLALQMPPAKAIEYFESKGYKIGWDWQALWEEANAKAFTVAGVTKIDVLQDIRNALSSALKEGKTLSDFGNELMPVLERKGWWGKNAQLDMNTGELKGKGLTPYRLKTIFQTNMQTAFMAGRYKAFMDNIEDRPWFEYVAVLDSRTRPSHRALNGRVFRHDDPFWQSLYPPNGFNCRCRVRARTQEDIDSGSLYPSKGIGRMEEVQVVASKRTGQLVDVTGYRDPITKKLFTPDPGWSYNPGQSWAKPFSPPPLDDLPRTFSPGVARPDLPKGVNISSDRMLPTSLPPESYATAFLKEFGATIENPVAYQDVAGDALTISADLFKDGAGRWKADKNNRGPWMLLLADTIKAPDEIWLRWEESRQLPGTWLLKRRYLKVFELDGSTFGIGAFEYGNDGWTGATVFHTTAQKESDRLRYLQQQREGFLRYLK
jgi:SPP1 gp7 family putative phage head morphogenesis protein